MKIYKINSFTTFLISMFLIGLVIFLPIMIIEAIWNSTIGTMHSYLAINTWQALILWLIFLTLLNILGVFRFEFAVEKFDGTNKESVKKKVEEIRGKNETKSTHVENTNTTENREIKP
ncbi:MAG: hypothetical protein HYR97_08805 [Candidatus Melainabacteria bacterium]|nr:hypothetical protein [Candidatus Melainabacteria bacterium]MBI3309496.1 hypothetical protein [Candidatus Melainabacteria bacterium]